MDFKTEYGLKVDSYYYDEFENQTKVVIRFRYKRSVLTIPINKIIRNKNILNGLHPHDVLLLGIISMPNTISKNLNKPIQIRDNLNMIKISPLIEIIGSSYAGGDECISFRIKGSDKIIDVSSNDILKQKNIALAINYHDALSLGISLGNNAQFLSKEFIGKSFKYRYDILLPNAVLLALIMIALLLSGKNFEASFAGIQISFDKSIILIPYILWLSLTSFKKWNKTHVALILASMLSGGLTFMGYYYLIYLLPYPHDAAYVETVSFNNLFENISTNAIVFLGSYAITIFAALIIDYKSTIKSIYDESAIYCAWAALFVPILYAVNMLFGLKLTSDFFQNIFISVLSIFPLLMVLLLLKRCKKIMGYYA